MPGGGVKGCRARGAADELGCHVVDKVTSANDLWATVLHLLGVEPENLTCLSADRNTPLTDVHGHMWRELIV